MKKSLFVLLSFRFLFGYIDPEIERLMASLSDPYHPTLEDYRKIEHYFQYGERPYLQTIKKCSHFEPKVTDWRIQQLREFKFVGPNGEMPILELLPLNVREETKNRCILIYASQNGPYPQKARRLLDELKECGYSGYVMLRIGGFPNVPYEGIRLCTIPYTFRIAFFREALNRGFTNILYMDSAMHPLTDLSAVFDAMDRYGLYSTHHAYNWLAGKEFRRHVLHYQIPNGSLPHIPFLHAYMTGLNFTNEKTSQLFKAWEQALQTIDEFCALGDDLHFSVLVWRFGFSLEFPFGTTVYESDIPPPPHFLPPSYLCYVDQHRAAIRQGWGPLYD